MNAIYPVEVLSLVLYCKSRVCPRVAGGGDVFSHLSYIGMCNTKEYGF